MKIDNYTIVREISRGPITTVYLARQESLDRTVLLKVLNVQWRGETDLVERFKREAKICARLRHPNIVNIYDFGTTEDSLYLAMEYLEGVNLEQFIQKYFPLPREVLLFIGKEILKGLQYAHSHGVVHRDIKPANIIIGDDGSVKITDFGLATIADLPAITNQGGTVGTPAYMSPEQAQGKRLDQRSDIFSLGVTIYKMSNGKNPFEGENYALSIQNILDKKPAPLKKINNGMPAALSDIVEKMLEKNPAKRPPSAGDILSADVFGTIFFERQILTEFIKNPRREDSTTVSPVKPEKRLLPLYFAITFVVAVIFVLGAILYNVESGKTNIAENKSSGNTTLPAPDTLKQKITITEDTTSQETLVAFKQTPPEPAQNSPGDTEEKSGRDLTANSEERLPPPEPQPGGIYITCFPWARVNIDGQYYETTPMQKPITLQPGEYLLELNNPNFMPYRERFTISSASIDTINIRLKPLIGYLYVQVHPWAEIHLNGLYVETTPLKKAIPLTAGKYELKLINPNTSSWIDSITIFAGQTTTKQIALEPRKSGND
ncbi:MAG: protein kinase [Calditrichia bacterium]